MKNVRPTEYSQKIADEICDGIAMGLTITDIVADPKMPDKRTINRWKKEHPDFWQHYLLAMQDRAEGLIDHLQKIEDDLLEGIIDAPTAKVLIDTKKWIASKFYPEMFGDKASIALNSVSKTESTIAFYPKDLEILERLGFKPA